MLSRDEIERYCSTAAGVCVYRQRVKKAQLVVQSISILRGDKRGAFTVMVEFDALGHVDEGEGYRWLSESEPLDTVVAAVENLIGRSLAEWENFTASGRVPSYSSPSLTSTEFEASWASLRRRYRDGRDLLPKGLKWRQGHLS